jgi:hypothetical protein
MCPGSKYRAMRYHWWYSSVYRVTSERRVIFHVWAHARLISLLLHDDRSKVEGIVEIAPGAMTK